MLSDLSQPLREQERQAWQRLIRVIGHELNNSLAPIKSIAGSLESLLGRTPPPDDWRDDMQRGLGDHRLARRRAEPLHRRLRAAGAAAAARAAAGRLSAPLVRRVVALETRLPVQRRRPAPRRRCDADPDQLEQLLINVVRNAVDAALETGGGVRSAGPRTRRRSKCGSTTRARACRTPANLFVPFFTTKPGGSGIGLVLSRQIAEGHGGSLTLENREGRSGARASLRLPLSQRAGAYFANVSCHSWTVCGLPASPPTTICVLLNRVS